MYGLGEGAPCGLKMRGDGVSLPVFVSTRAPSLAVKHGQPEGMAALLSTSGFSNADGLTGQAHMIPGSHPQRLLFKPVPVCRTNDKLAGMRSANQGRETRCC